MNLENASISLAAVRATLEQDGQAVAARTLRGIEVNNIVDAQAALVALHNVDAQSDEARVAVTFAIDACTRVNLPNVA